MGASSSGIRVVDDGESIASMKIDQVVQMAFSGNVIEGFSAAETGIMLQIWSHIRKKEFVTGFQVVEELKNAGLVTDEDGNKALKALEMLRCVESAHSWGAQHMSIYYSRIRSDLELVAEKIYTGQYSFSNSGNGGVRPQHSRQKLEPMISSPEPVAFPAEEEKRPETKRKKPPENILDEKDAKIVELLAKDWTLTKIGKEIGFSPRPRVAKLEKRGVLRRESLDEYVFRLKQRGMNEFEIRNSLPAAWLGKGYHYVPNVNSIKVGYMQEQSEQKVEQKRDLVKEKAELNAKIIELLGQDKTGSEISRIVSKPQPKISQTIAKLAAQGLVMKESVQDFGTRLKEQGLDPKNIDKILVQFKSCGYHWVPARSGANTTQKSEEPKPKIRKRRAAAPEIQAPVHETEPDDKTVEIEIKVQKKDVEKPKAPEPKHKLGRPRKRNAQKLIAAWQDTHNVEKTAKKTGESREHLHRTLRDMGALIRKRDNGRLINVDEQQTLWPIDKGNENDLDIAEGIQIIQTQMGRIITTADSVSNKSLARHFKHVRNEMEHGLLEMAAERKLRIEAERAKAASKQLDSATEQIRSALKHASPEVVAKLLKEKLDPRLLEMVRKETRSKSRR